MVRDVHIDASYICGRSCQVKPIRHLLTRIICSDPEYSVWKQNCHPICNLFATSRVCWSPSRYAYKRAIFRRAWSIEIKLVCQSVFCFKQHEISLVSKLFNVPKNGPATWCVIMEAGICWQNNILSGCDNELTFWLSGTAFNQADFSWKLFDFPWYPKPQIITTSTEDVLFVINTRMQHDTTFCHALRLQCTVRYVIYMASCNWLISQWRVGC